MMNVASMAAVALWLAIALGAPHPSDAGEGSPRKGCVSAKFTPPNEQSPYGDARVVNECGHNDVAVWVGANWTVFSKKGAGHFEALDEDDLTHAVVRMPSQYPSGSPFVISRPVVGEDFAFKVCAHHVPGIDYALVAKWNNIRAEVLPPMYDDPRTDPRFKSGFEMLVRRGIPIESVKYLKRRIVDTYPFYGWYGERGLDSYFEVGTTALGKRLLKFYRENRGVCHPENLLNASQDPVTARVGGSQRQRESSITAADSGTFGPQARDAIQAWQSKNGISDAGNFVNTLALMVQTALVLQNFDPGPADGLFGKKTLAAILAWQAAMGYAQTGDLAGVLAAVLRTALVLQGFDPGPLDGMFGAQAHGAIQAWQPGHTQALAAAVPVSAQRQDLWGAISYSQHSDGGWAFGMAWDIATRSRATQKAQEECRKKGGEGCKEVLWFVNGCGALAVSDEGNGFGTASGKTESEAGNAALSKCREYNRSCHVETLECTGAVADAFESQPLQDFHVTVPSGRREVEVCVRDHECEDGDQIRVSVNGRQVFSGEIGNSWSCTDVPVSQGRNTVEMFAVNGTGFKGNCLHSDANTGALRVQGRNNQTQSWKHRGGTGSSANIVVEVR